jgi:hypothetical protein
MGFNYRALITWSKEPSIKEEKLGAGWPFSGPGQMWLSPLYLVNGVAVGWKSVQNASEGRGLKEPKKQAEQLLTHVLICILLIEWKCYLFH